MQNRSKSWFYSTFADFDIPKSSNSSLRVIVASDISLCNKNSKKFTPIYDSRDNSTRLMLNLYLNFPLLSMLVPVPGSAASILRFFLIKLSLQTPYVVLHPPQLFRLWSLRCTP